MIGDKIRVSEAHVRAADTLYSHLEQSFNQPDVKLVLAICGESGSGKSELAVALQDRLKKEHVSSVIFQQDDYFRYPPLTNAKLREKNISQVGPQEVNLKLLDEHLSQFKQKEKNIKKPLVNYEQDAFGEEIFYMEKTPIAIVEGTYTCSLKNIDVRIFIDRIYSDTRKDRLTRAREEQNDFLEQVLEIEHKIIRTYKANADFIVDDSFLVKKVENEI